MQVHVECEAGEAQLWLDPQIKPNHNLSQKDLIRIRELILEHEREIRDAWHRHFGS